MTKFFADIVEKLTVGAFCMGLFQDNKLGVIIGATGFVFWFVLRIKEIRAKGARNGS